MLEKNDKAHTKKDNFIADYSEKLFSNIEINPKKQSLRIAFINFIVGCLWILVSDKLLEFLIKDQATVTFISIVKGWCYVFITSLIIFLLVFAALKKVIDSKDKIRQYEEETLKNKMGQEMARLDRLSLVGEMAAGIGHEVRNPMTTVRGFLQLLSTKKECSKYNNYYTLMIQELDRANSIITEFLSLAKDRVVELKVQSLKEIVQNIFPLIQADGWVSDKNIHIELAEVPEIPLNEKEIRQLILNLVLNGSQAMSPGGTIDIRTFMDNGEIVLSVQDDGPGIASEVLEKIGTPFFTTKENGTGLGLAVCYSIAARHNAKIDIETGSTGTTFSVRFKT